MNNQPEHPEETRARVPGMSPSAGDFSGGVVVPADGDEIDWRELFETLWGYRKAIAAFVLLTTISAGLYAFLSPKYYKADTLIATVDNSGTGGKSSQLSALGGLAGLAGLSVNNDSGKEVAIAMLSSRVLVEAMIRDKNLLPILFQRKWDAEKQAWKDPDPEEVPTLLDGYDFFTKKIVVINEDKKKGLVTITVEWKSPALAAEWANELVKRTNDELRRRALDESEHNLSYLQEQVQQTGIVEMRQAIYGLMENELKKAMLAKGNEQYAFKVVDPAVVPERKSRPKRLIILMFGFFGGWFAGVAAALLHRRFTTL